MVRGHGQVETVTRPRYSGDPSPSVEAYTYDPAGNVKTFRDANHDAANVEYFYDPLGRLARVEQLLDEVADTWIATSYGYDLHGNLTSVEDANGNETTYVVDDFGRTTQVLSPVTGTTEMTYNPAGALATRTDALNVTLTADHDAAGRLTQQVYDDGGSTEIVSFAYDAGGRRTRAEVSDGVDALVVETFGHNRRGQVVTATVSVGLDSYPQAAYVYGHDGELEKVTYPSGRVVTYTPDFAGRPKTITTIPPGGGTAVTVLADATYLPAGPPSTLALGPGGSIAETLGHDWQYRRTMQTVGSWIGLSYGYDAAGNLTTVTDPIDNRDATYTYDDLSRLRSAYLDGAARTYTYDNIGNITEQSAGGVPVTYGYEPNLASQNSPVLTTINGPWGPEETVVTDDAGNITDDGSQTYLPDLRNHLGTREVSTATLVNTYTADGRLARTENAGDIHTQILDPAGRRLALLRSGEGWRDYVYLGDRLLGYFDAGDSAAKLVFADHIGMPMLVVDGDGVVRWSSRAEPYGQLRDEVNKTFDPGLRYPGQWQDWLELEASCVGDNCTLPTPIQESLSLFENGYRWLRPDWGRFAAPDPLGLQAGVNLFRYADASPKVRTDPLGLFTWACTVIEGSVEVFGGGGLYYVECTRECFKNFRYKAHFLAWSIGVGANVRLSFPGSASTWDLDDSACHTGSPQCLEGALSVASAAGGIGAGTSLTSVRMGSASGTGPGPAAIFGAGWYAALGWANLLESSEECCDRPRPKGPFMAPETPEVTIGPVP